MRWQVTAAMLMLAGAAMAADAPPAVHALDGVRMGRWRLHDLDAAAPDRFLCAAEPEQIVYLGHGGPGCARRVIDDAPPHATVQFTCPGRGNGRTALTVETTELVTIEAQGIEAGAPFDQRLEARWLGDCNAR